MLTLRSSLLTIKKLPFHHYYELVEKYTMSQNLFLILIGGRFILKLKKLHYYTLVLSSNFFTVQFPNYFFWLFVTIIVVLQRNFFFFCHFLESILHLNQNFKGSFRILLLCVKTEIALAASLCCKNPTELFSEFFPIHSFLLHYYCHQKNAIFRSRGQK